MHGIMKWSMLTYSATSHFSPLLLRLIYIAKLQNFAKYHSLYTTI